MPGYELIGEEEKNALLEIFENSNGVMFAHGFDARRNNIFRVREFEKLFANKLGAKHGQAVSSGTTALMTALHSLGIRAGDEVITQSFTFVATVEAILSVGATPVLTDIDLTFNMDPIDLESKITSKTKAIIPVHMAGNPASMTEIMKIAKKHNLYVIEDTAQAIGAKYNDQYLGTLGDYGTFSLDFGKTITTGEGGMLLTNNQDLYQKALEYHDHGHEYNPSVGRALDTRKTWGLNFRMSELNAAVGIAQLNKLDYIVNRSKSNAIYIKEALSKIPGIRWRKTPAGAQDNGDAIYLYFDNQADSKKALQSLQNAGLGTKNVPDAMKWHFAGEWEHIYDGRISGLKQNQRSWSFTENLLGRTIALPVLVLWEGEALSQQANKLEKALRFA